VNQSLHCTDGDRCCIEARGLVLVLFFSFVVICSSQAFIITCVARFLDHSRFILFMGFVLVVF